MNNILLENFYSTPMEAPWLPPMLQAVVAQWGFLTSLRAIIQIKHVSPKLCHLPQYSYRCDVMWLLIMFDEFVFFQRLFFWNPTPFRRSLHTNIFLDLSPGNIGVEAIEILFSLANKFCMTLFAIELTSLFAKMFGKSLTSLYSSIYRRNRYQ